MINVSGGGNLKQMEEELKALRLRTRTVLHRLHLRFNRLMLGGAVNNLSPSRNPHGS